MAEAILDGRLYIEYNEPEQIQQLQALDNPYDPEQREEASIDFHWDHSFYNGHYYMYFGIVPVFVLFLPYRVVTGSSLTTYHATQIFTAMIILGIFALFNILRKRFFKQIPFWVYILLSASSSLITMRYSIACPALYCTAINSALAFQIWSFYFFIKAVWVTENENKQIGQAAVGALLGALVFGCRPTIALGNFLVIPMLIVFLKQRKFTAALFGKLCLAASPYLIIGIALMLYNYTRFGSPFEFGQSYQLTWFDINAYSDTMTFSQMLRILWHKKSFWIKLPHISKSFPFIENRGILTSYPIFLFLIGMLRPSFWKMLRKEKLTMIVVGLLLLMAVITVLENLWSPILILRYQMDLFFLLGILCYIVIGFHFGSCSEKQIKPLAIIAIGLAILCIALDVLYYASELMNSCPDVPQKIKQLLG